MILGGQVGPDWILGLLRKDGKLDADFGKDGWAVLSVPDALKATGSPDEYLPGVSLTSVVQASNGTIYVGGTNGDAHCCVKSMVASVAPTGELNSSYGTGGWADVLEQGSTTLSLLPQDNGNLLVEGEIAYTGCGTMELQLLSPEGTLETEFDSNAQDSLSALTDNSKTTGFLVGAIENRAQNKIGVISYFTTAYCAAPEGPTFNFATDAVLEPDGTLDSSYAPHGYRIIPFDPSANLWVFPTRSGGVVVGTQPFGTNQSVRVREFRANGAVNRDFGSHGTLILPVKALQSSASDPYPPPDDVLVLAGPGTVLFLVGTPRDVELRRWLT